MSYEGHLTIWHQFNDYSHLDLNGVNEKTNTTSFRNRSVHRYTHRANGKSKLLQLFFPLNSYFNIGHFSYYRAKEKPVSVAQ